MFIYNVTVNVEDSIREGWVAWMRTKHIPDVMASGCFSSHRMCKVVSEDPGATYAMQYSFNAREDLDRYLKRFAPKLRQEFIERYGDKAPAMRTILEVIE